MFTLLLSLVAIATTARAQFSIGHEYVDLDLPSGTFWATCNVGSNSPEKYGSYFAWGETKPKDNYDWVTYKWCKDSNDKLTKYCNDSSFGDDGFTDDKTELDLEDDAAYVNWGSNWRMPDLDQIKELIENCNWELTYFKGVYGAEATSKKNGKSIFFPGAGYRRGTSLFYAGSEGYYWSRTLDTKERQVFYLFFISCGVGDDYSSRCSGRSVRPVTDKKIMSESDGIEPISHETFNNNYYYSIDGKRLNDEPRKKGVYIRNGRKVVK